MSDDELDTNFLQGIYTRLREHDASAGNDLLLRVSRRLERLARKILRGFPGVHRGEEIAEILQAANLKLINALDQIQPPSTRHFIGLAAEQIRRTLVDLARHYQGPQSHGAHHASGVLDSAGPSGMPTEPVAPAGRAEKIDKWCEFHEAVERLPMMEREVFSLSFYLGWRQTDIAKLLEVSERTVRRFWQSACDLLREDLGDGRFLE